MRTIVRLLCLAMLAVGLIATPAQAQAPLTKLTKYDEFGAPGLVA